jgi:hypothetical protein
MGSWPKIYRYKECPDCDACWRAFLDKQRERAKDDLGEYAGAKVPLSKVNADQAIALVLMYEKEFVAHDQWDRDTGDVLITDAVRFNPQTNRPERGLNDELTLDEAWVLWSTLAARADVLNVFCECSRSKNYRGVCPPDTWTYEPSRIAQLRRLERLTVAAQRRYKLVKPPPINPIGELLRALGWVLLIAIVAAEGEPFWKQERN